MTLQLLPPLHTLAAFIIGPLQFDAPQWFLLFPILLVLVLLLARRSLAGLGSTLRYVALGFRLVVILLLVAALSEPHWRRESDDIAVTAVLDVSQSVPARLQDQAQAYLEEAANAAERTTDRLGVITVGRDARVQSLPSRLARRVERDHGGGIDGTNLGAGLTLGLAVMPRDAANRLLLVSDGNDTSGDLLRAAETARALGVPIDVLPMRFAFENEVIVERLVAPAAAREGETLNLRVVLRATRPANGRLQILMDGQPLDLDPSSPALGAPVELNEGLNVMSVPVPATRSGAERFEAVFEPEVLAGRVTGDSVAENNRSLAVTFVAGEPRVLILADTAEEAEPLLRVLSDANIQAEVRPGNQAPQSLTEWNGYEAVVLLNQPAFSFTQRQQEELRQYVHDAGGGVIMVGGPNTFGAGGWIGSAFEDALPLKLDPPQKRQMPRGALALVIHSVEMPEGTFWGKKVAESAVNALSRLDFVGINEFSWDGGTRWVHALQPIGDGTAVKRAIQNLTFGDMPDFRPSIELTLEGLINTNAGQKHVIIISDGDPTPPSTALLDRYVENRITISTVGVFPHSAGDTSTLRFMSSHTGGRHYEVNTNAGLATIPQIFIKEAQTVRRSLIWEGSPFTPTLVGVASETLRGIPGALPPISGYVVTAERDGLALVTMRAREGDPLAAQWQHGLGRVMAFTSDATTRWAPSWTQWPVFRAFWEQHLRWAMRPTGSANVRVATENRGESTLITVDALDSAGERLNFAQFRGRLAKPDGTGIDVNLRQVGPGRYSAEVPTELAGAYVLSLRYAAADPRIEGGTLEGSLQAAITRPFADEFRTLRDNAAVLTQIAEMTGGRVLSWDPRTDQLWSRDGLEKPVSLSPIWLAVALAGVTLFLVDVAVRRVRIEPAAIFRAVQRALGRSQSRDAQQLGSLRAAREKAQARMDRAGEDVERAAAREAAEAVARAAERARASANVKFEASPDQARKSDQTIALGGADARPEPPRIRPPQADAGSPGGGLDRLRKARERARDAMDDTPRDTDQPGNP